MRSKPRYIILFYDHSTKVLSMVELLKQLPGPLEIICVEQFQHVLDHVQQKMPDAIIVFINNPVNSYIDCLKNLRINNGHDEIPVYVFTDLPDAATILNLMTIKKA